MVAGKLPSVSYPRRVSHSERSRVMIRVAAFIWMGVDNIRPEFVYCRCELLHQLGQMQITFLIDKIETYTVLRRYSSQFQCFSQLESPRFGVFHWIGKPRRLSMARVAWTASGQVHNGKPPGIPARHPYAGTDHFVIGISRYQKNSTFRFHNA